MRVSVIQLNSGADVGENLRQASRLIRSAAKAGARLVVLPENFAIYSEGVHHAQLAENPDGDPSDAPIITSMRDLAHQLAIYLVLGGMPTVIGERQPVGSFRRYHNSALLLGPQGDLLARYHKIHRFDLSLSDGPSYRESDHVIAGDMAVSVPVETTRLGLSICYDIRFPELYRTLVLAGAEVFVVPAAFTAHTGRAHWSVLLRARAIENQAYVLAAAQVGRNEAGQESYGHSCIIDPWGRVLGLREAGSGIVTADLDFAAQGRLRGEFPCLSHRHAFGTNTL